LEGTGSIQEKGRGRGRSRFEALSSFEGKIFSPTSRRARVVSSGAGRARGLQWYAQRSGASESHVSEFPNVRGEQASPAEWRDNHARADEVSEDKQVRPTLRSRRGELVQKEEAGGKHAKERALDCAGEPNLHDSSSLLSHRAPLVSRRPRVWARTDSLVHPCLTLLVGSLARLRRCWRYAPCSSSCFPPSFDCTGTNTRRS